MSEVYKAPENPSIKRFNDSKRSYTLELDQYTAKDGRKNVTYVTQSSSTTNWMKKQLYNFYKSTEAKLSAKVSINLKSTPFFSKPDKHSKVQRTILLHHEFKNNTGRREL